MCVNDGMHTRVSTCHQGTQICTRTSSVDFGPSLAEGNTIRSPAVLQLNACNRAGNQWHIKAEALLKMINREFFYP